MRTKCKEWASKDAWIIPVAIYTCNITTLRFSFDNNCLCIQVKMTDHIWPSNHYQKNRVRWYNECHHDIVWNFDLSIQKRLVKLRHSHNIQTLVNKISEMISRQEQNKVWILMIIAWSVAVSLLIDTCNYDVNINEVDLKPCCNDYVICMNTIYITCFVLGSGSGNPCP